MKKSPLNNKNKKIIFKLETEEVDYYILSFNLDNGYYGDQRLVSINLTGDPNKAKRLVRMSTIEKYLIYIEKYFRKKVKTLYFKKFFYLNNEVIQLLPINTVNIIKELKDKIEDNNNIKVDNFDIKKAFKEKDFKKLRELKNKILLLFELEKNNIKVKNFNLEEFSAFNIKLVEVNNEIRAQKLRTINLTNNEL